jgi:serine/threonine protein kinase
MFHIGVATQAPPLPEPGQLSDTGIEFIELCLTLDPPGRPSAEELLYHPWLAAMVQHLVRVGQHAMFVADVLSSLYTTALRPLQPMPISLTTLRLIIVQLKMLLPVVTAQTLHLWIIHTRLRYTLRRWRNWRIKRNWQRVMILVHLTLQRAIRRLLRSDLTRMYV